MYRTIPTGNKICSTKETLQNQQILVNHLTHMRSQIDTKAPQKFQSKKVKNEKLRQIKQNEIDRENHHLLNKITGIMQSHSTSHSSLIQYKKSLNSNHRKNELIKIVVDNQALLKRIQEQRSKYDIKTWDQERLDVEKQIANICEFPFKDYKPNKTLVQFWNTSKLSESQLLKKDLPKKLEPLSRNSQVHQNQEYQGSQTAFQQDHQSDNQILEHTKPSTHTVQERNERKEFFEEKSQDFEKNYKTDPKKTFFDANPGEKQQTFSDRHIPSLKNIEIEQTDEIKHIEQLDNFIEAEDN